MPKATHHDAVARLFELLKLLPSRGPGITAREICARLDASGFSVSKRTVERDLTELSRLFGLECNDKSQPYGWRWAQHQGLSLPGLGLTDAQEAFLQGMIGDFMTRMLALLDHRNETQDALQRLNGRLAQLRAT